jgi:hypothetical protein
MEADAVGGAGFNPPENQVVPLTSPLHRGGETVGSGVREALRVTFEGDEDAAQVLGYLVQIAEAWAAARAEILSDPCR